MQSGNPAADVSLTVSPATAAPGDSSTLTLDNHGTEQIGYNLCASSLERQTADAWVLVDTDIICTMELRTLDAGEQARFRTALPMGLPAGRYRYTTSIEAMRTGGRYAISSSAFTISS